MRRTAPAVACGLLACVLTSPAGAVPGPGASERIAARMLADTPVVSDLQTLCDRIGGRPTGSAACERAVDWFVGRFREAGADRAWTETFKVPLRWEEGRSRAAITSPDRVDLRVVALPFSPGTPKSGLEAPVVDLGDGSIERFQSAGTRLRGAFGLIDSKVMATWQDLFDDYLRLPAIKQRARVAGAAGLLLVGGRAHNMLYRHDATFGDDDPVPFPMAIVAREDGLRLARMAAQAVARVKLELDVRKGPAFESRNVLAEIRGRERPDEIVLVGAHLDSWELGTGALDNGANCAMILDLARQMAASGLKPRRTVRFVLFTGEEQGMYGSLGYVRSHRDEMDRHVVAVIFDSGTGRITGFSQGGRDDLASLLQPALAAVAGYGASLHTTDASVGTDNYDFLLEGVPNLVANQEAANYMENYHASSDTFDKVDLRELRINGAIAAAVVWGMGDTDARTSRLDRGEIAALLERSGLGNEMKTYGMWSEWEKKVRGRAE